MKRVLVSVPVLMGLALAGPGSALADESTNKGEASNGFMVHVAPNTTAEDVIPKIVAAGREQFAAACAAHPGAAIRVMNPLASGSYDDVSCAAILDGGELVVLLA